MTNELGGKCKGGGWFGITGSERNMQTLNWSYFTFNIFQLIYRSMKPKTKCLAAINSISLSFPFCPKGMQTLALSCNTMLPWLLLFC